MAYDVERDGPSNGGASGGGGGGLTSSGTIYSPGVVATSAAPVYYHEGEWSFKDEDDTNAYQNLQKIQNYNYALWNAQNTYNKELYNDSKKWYEKMSNTAIQRQVEDMKKAGINPVLAARYGGATTPNINAPYSSAAPYASEQAQASLTNSLLDNAYNYYKANQDRELTEMTLNQQMERTNKELENKIKTTEMENSTRIALQEMINANQIILQENEYEMKDILAKNQTQYNKEYNTHETGNKANLMYQQYIYDEALAKINNDNKINYTDKQDLTNIISAAIKAGAMLAA